MPIDVICKKAGEQVRKMKEVGIFTVQCPKCKILLHGRDEYIGHMYHSHNFTIAQLDGVVHSISS